MAWALLVAIAAAQPAPTVDDGPSGVPLLFFCSIAVPLFFALVFALSHFGRRPVEAPLPPPGEPLPEDPDERPGDLDDLDDEAPPER